MKQMGPIRVWRDLGFYHRETGEMLKIRTSACRVGIVGMYNSGKTVFLTSLINHLKNHNPNAFRLGDDGIGVSKFRTGEADPGWKLFDYELTRFLFKEKRWPAKTREPMQFVCSFQRTDWKLHDVKLKFFDLPGDRLADAVMLTSSYAEWSDHILKRLRTDSDHETNFAEFLQRVELGGEAVAADWLRDYKIGLANSILKYRPYVSPSTFHLDVRDVKFRPASRESPEAIADQRCVGLDSDSEFTPLPADVRAKHPVLSGQFEAHYRRYREKIVMPLFTTLSRCDSLIVLVDVLTILASGHGMYVDHEQMLDDLLRVLDPGQSLLGRMMRRGAGLLLPHSFRPAKISRVAFVAPKLDLVAEQSDKGKMSGLVEEMAWDWVRDRDGLDLIFTNCSAVVSTEPFDSDGQQFLKGVLLRGPDGKIVPPGEPQKFEVSSVPDEWPETWEPGRYYFPEVYPEIPKFVKRPPKQVNLDQILEFVVSGRRVGG